MKTLLQAKRSHLHKPILDSTHGLFFFALPHQILRTEKLNEILDVDSNGQGPGDNSLSQLKKSLEFLGYDWKGLQCIWRELKQKVVVFSETGKTPSARKVII
jgi:hypothetical protein